MTGIGTAASQYVGKHSLENVGYCAYLQLLHSTDTFSQPSRGSLVATQTNRPRTGDVLYSTPTHILNGAPGVEGAADEYQSAHNATPRDGATRPKADVPQSVYGQSSIKDDTSDIDPPILTSSRAFRDSAFSSNTRYSHEIPIAWTGGLDLEKLHGKMSPGGANEPVSTYFANIPETSVLEPSERPQAKSPEARTSIYPGGRKPSPVAEEPEEVYGFDATDDEQAHPQPRTTSDLDKRDVVAARKASPIPLVGAATRRSEAASFGQLRIGNPSNLHAQSPVPSPTTISSPSSPSSPSSQRHPNEPGSSSIGGGWVLVNVESSRAKTDPMANRVTPNGRRLSSNPLGNSGSRSPSHPQQQQTHAPTSMSPIAKVIVAQDAISPAVDENNTTGLKRLFSKSKSRKRLSKNK
jgi:hypothetical protein